MKMDVMILGKHRRIDAVKNYLSLTVKHWLTKLLCAPPWRPFARRVGRHGSIFGRLLMGVRWRAKFSRRRARSL